MLQAIPLLLPAYGAELYGAGWDDQLLEQLRANAHTYLSGVAASLRAESLHVRTAVVDGLPSGAILEHARAQAVDLIALATHGRSGAARWLLGGVADKVVRGATLPVLLYRPQSEATADELSLQPRQHMERGGPDGTGAMREASAW